MTPLAATTFVTKDEVKNYVFARNDEELVIDADAETLYLITDAVCLSIEKLVSAPPIKQSGLTYHDDGGSRVILLRHYPIVSVEEVTQGDGEVVSSSDYYADLDEGAVYSSSGLWYSGEGGVTVEYTAGYGTQVRPMVDPEPPEGPTPDMTQDFTSVIGVPDPLRLVALSWARAIWLAGPANFSNDQGASYSIPEGSLPDDAMQLLSPWVRRAITIA